MRKPQFQVAKLNFDTAYCFILLTKLVLCYLFIFLAVAGFKTRFHAQNVRKSLAAVVWSDVDCLARAFTLLDVVHSGSTTEMTHDYYDYYFA